MKTHIHFHAGHVRLALTACAMLLLSFTAQTDVGEGKLIYKTGSKAFDMQIKSAYFIAGPDGFDSGKKIRRLIFTTNTLDDKIKSCSAMNCVDLTLTTDTSDHLAGTLKFDQSASGGPVVDITFDAKLLKAFAKAR